MKKRPIYFQQLDAALKSANIYQPTLVLDLDRLDKNIETLSANLPSGMAYRIVAKSLPVLKLLKHISQRANTDRLMTFNLPMLLELAQAMPDANQMLGKPLPVAALRDFIIQSSQGACERVHWLIDTPKRLAEYANVATELRQKLNVVLELDIGLHRGGFISDHSLRATLKQLSDSNCLQFQGFMGYEPHLASIPKVLGWRARAVQKAWTNYKRAIDCATDIFGSERTASLSRNVAGSPTYGLYTDTSIGNEISAGSALVKPSYFDTDMLQAFEPACFIAAPLLKSVGATQLPAFEFAEKLYRLFFPNKAQSFFIHGGKWMADPVDPPKLSYNKIYGRSSNQEMLNGPTNIDLSPDDFVFFRPHQSEAVFLQFGDIAVIRNGKVIDRWPTLSCSA